MSMLRNVKVEQTDKEFIFRVSKSEERNGKPYFDKKTGEEKITKTKYLAGAGNGRFGGIPLEGSDLEFVMEVRERPAGSGETGW
jgi:hypothetical protein